MAIAFSCSCGKAMKAKEAFAGRKVKCPYCDQIVRIPDLHEEGAYPNGLARSPQEAAAAARAPQAHASVSPHQPESPPPSAARAAVPVSDRDNAERNGADHNGASVPPLARPDAVAPDMRVTPAWPAREAAHIWVDSFLAQKWTPWLPGDEERFQRGIKSPREGMSGAERTVMTLAGLTLTGTLVWLLGAAK